MWIAGQWQRDRGHERPGQLAISQQGQQEADQGQGEHSKQGASEQGASEQLRNKVNVRN